MFPKRGGGGRTKISATLKTDQGWKSHSAESSPTSKRQPLRTGGARRSPRTLANEVNFTPEEWGAHSVKVQEDSIPCLSLPALSISTGEPGREKPGTGVRPAAERFLRRPHRSGGHGTGQGASGGEARRDLGTPSPGRAPPCGAGCRNPSSPAAKTFPKTRSFSGTTSVSPASSPPHTPPNRTPFPPRRIKALPAGGYLSLGPGTPSLTSYKGLRAGACGRARGAWPQPVPPGTFLT